MTIEQKQFLAVMLYITQSQFLTANLGEMKLYGTVYYVSNVCIPFGIFLFQTIKKIKNKQGLGTQISVVPNTFQFGKAFLLIVVMLLFNILNYFMKKDYTVMMIGMILKILILYFPSKINLLIESVITKLHLQAFVQRTKVSLITYYFRIVWTINATFLNLLSSGERQIILKEDKQINLQLQQTQQPDVLTSQINLKLNLQSNRKYFQNTGINCNIISLPEAQINQQILHYIKNKSSNMRQKQLKTSNFQIISPTKQISVNNINILLTERQKQSKLNIYPQFTQRPKTAQIKNQNLYKGQLKQSQFKKQQVFTSNLNKRYLQDQAFKNSVKYSQKSLQIQHKKHPTQQNYYMTQLERSNNSKNQEMFLTNNPNNFGIIDINMSENSSILKNSLSQSRYLNDEVVKSQLAQPSIMQMSTEYNKKLFLAAQGINNISSIRKSHPFSINLQNLKNPLIISASNILPSSIIRNKDGLKKITSTNLQNQNVNNQNLVQQFNSQSSISNKLQNSVSESEYSDIFDSEQDQNKVQCKVQAVVQRQKKPNQAKSRLQIYMIQLFQNSDLKFYSLYDKVVFEGRLLRMVKQEDNYYNLIVQDYSTTGQQNNNQKEIKIDQNKQSVELTKRIKFRGQAKPFMKYLAK